MQIIFLISNFAIHVYVPSLAAMKSKQIYLYNLCSFFFQLMPYIYHL